jgi:hypothetical protein
LFCYFHFEANTKSKTDSFYIVPLPGSLRLGQCLQQLSLGALLGLLQKQHQTGLFVQKYHLVVIP